MDIRSAMDQTDGSICIADRRTAYVSSLLDEFKRERFVAFLQPLYRIREKRVYGAEALVRRVDEAGQIHAPYEFIRMLEKEKLIPQVDYIILEQACNLLTEWKERWPDLKINCNMSRVTLSEQDYIERVREIIERTGADPHQLVFEVTESARVVQMDSLAEILSRLKEIGVEIALDDMGTEQSCLEMLFLPQFDAVKIDRSLICKIENSVREQSIIASILEMCHRVKLRCVAEGIESKSQMELLTRLGCDCLQGYYFGKPMPPEEFFRLFYQPAT